MNGPNNPAYEALCKASHDTGWPTRFQDDLHVHDKGQIERDALHLIPFVWGLRDQGTYLLPLNGLRDARYPLQELPEKLGQHRWFGWDPKGRTLTEMELPELKKWIVAHSDNISYTNPAPTVVEVADFGHMLKVVTFAHNMGDPVVHSLLEQLQYLTSYGEGFGWRISIHPSGDKGFSVAWYRRNLDGSETFSMNGGLIYHEDSSTWSIHT